MWKTATVTAVLTTLVSIGATAQDVKTVIDETTKAMGAVGLDSITYSGAAAQGNFGQSRTISFGLASTAIRNYTRTIDFTKPASRATGDTFPPTVAGAPPPMPGTYHQNITSATPSWNDQLQIWVTPWGFLRGAAASKSTIRGQKIRDVNYKVVTWSPAQKSPSGQSYKVAGYISPDHVVDRVETWVEHPILGDLHLEFLYTNYQDVRGLKVPAKISQRAIGMETFVVAIGEVLANPPDLDDRLSAPPTPPGAAPAAAGATAAVVASEKIADGVYRITGGYVSLAVEFKDHVVVLEGGQNDARGLAVIAEVKRLFPTTRIKYVVNTHPHFDHMGGLPAFVAEGITILTDDNSKYFVEQALATPRTLGTDVLAKARKSPKVEEVVEKMVLKDEMRTLELHHVAKLEHSDAMLMAYLPKEKILFTADFNVPGPGQAVSPSLATLVQNIERLQLDFERHITVHAPNPDRPLTRADLMALVKKTN
jgi:glyoxylase-like metal-dependent hydrolase (beta-lactamase superfamily II)